MMVWYRCTVKGCTYKRKENDAASYVAHYVKGAEHPMKKEEPHGEP